MVIFPSHNVSIRDVVSFSLYDNTTIGTVFSRVRIIGVVDYDTASNAIDPVALHEDIITNLPEGSIDDPTAYSYLKVQMENGNKTFIGMPWINMSTLERVGSSKLQLTIDEVNSDDVPRILAALTSNGFTVSDTKIL